MSDEDGSQANWMKSLGYFSIILGDLVGFTGAGIGIGYFAWKKWGAPWWVLLVSCLAGLSLSMVRLYRMTQKDME